MIAALYEFPQNKKHVQNLKRKTARHNRRAKTLNLNNFRKVTWWFYEDLQLMPWHHLLQPPLLPQQVADQEFLAFQQP